MYTKNGSHQSSHDSRRNNSGHVPSIKKSSKWRKTLITGTGIAAILGVVLSGCGATDSAGKGTYSSDNPITLTYADYAPSNTSGPFDAFAQEVAKATEGRVKMDPYWGGSLLGSADLASGLESGVADFGIFVATHNASEFPVTDWVSSLASIGSTEFPDGILQTHAGMSDFAYRSEPINTGFEKSNLKQLQVTHSTVKHDLICTKPVQNLADAKGLRVRSGGELFDRELAAAGMVPVTVPIEETYQGLQRGVVDCTVASPETAITYGFWEVATYYTELPMSGVNGKYVVFNQDSWDSLSKEDQSIIMDASHEWWASTIKISEIDNYIKLRETGEEEHGMTFLEADQDLIEPIVEAQEEELHNMVENAPAAVENPEKVIADYEDTMARWLEKVEGMDLGSEKSPDLSEFKKTTKTEIWDANTP